MKTKKPQNSLFKNPIFCLILGLFSALIGVLNRYFPGAVTPLSISGFFVACLGLVLCIAARKRQPNKPPLAASIGLVASIVGFLWNLVFFVACSSLACGGTNIF